MCDMRLHFLDLQTRYVHTTYDVREQCNHIIIAHGHVGNNLLEGCLLRREVFILLTAAVQFEAQLCYFALLCVKVL